MEQVDWPIEFEEVLRSHLPDPPAVGKMEPDYDLVAGGIDSLETIALMTELEERFGFVFSNDLLSTDTFSKPEVLWSAVSVCIPSKPE